MAIPSIQAKVYCNLGRVISGQFADDYVQDSGLMKTRGSVDLDGIYTIEVGQKAEFAFLKDGNLSRIPRTLRVLSSYADPFTSVTKVSLGCLLTYLSDVRKPQQVDAGPEEDPEARFKIRAFLDPVGGGAIPLDRRPAVGGFITAGFMLQSLLTELGLAAASIPLENKYTKTEEEVTGPFVDKVADLLKSECFYGYLDEDEVLQAINLNDLSTSTGPVIEGEDLLSVDRIGSGELPGQAVFVRYQTRRLKPPDPATLRAAIAGGGLAGIGSPSGEEDLVQQINWELSISESLPIEIKCDRKVGAATESIIYTGFAWSATRTEYKLLYDKEVPASKVEVRRTFAAEAAQNMAQAYWENNGTILNNIIVQTVVTTSYQYDGAGNEIGTTTSTYEPKIAIFGRANLPVVLSPTDYVGFGGAGELFLTRYEVNESSNADGFQKRSTQMWESRLYHLQGQIGAYQSGKDKTTAAEVLALFQAMLTSNLQLETFDIESQFVGRATSEERPKQVERVADYYSQKSGEGRIPERTETTLVYGNALSQRVIELSLPMSPDDTIERSGGMGFALPPGVLDAAWAAVPSVAAQRAQAYGKVQNRMRLGHREGLSIQVAPEMMPSVPFAPIYVKAAGITGQYRVNGSSWTFDANGIVCSIDAMFWGGAGQE
jgi:hypothetical protein